MCVPVCLCTYVCSNQKPYALLKLSDALREEEWEHPRRPSERQTEMDAAVAADAARYYHCSARCHFQSLPRLSLLARTLRA